MSGKQHAGDLTAVNHRPGPLLPALGPAAPAPRSLPNGLGNQAQLDLQHSNPYLLPDSAAGVGPGQMRKTEFLAHLERQVTATAQERLAPAGRSTEDCPYLAFWFPYYEGKSSRHLDRAIRRFAPEAGRAGDAAAAIEMLSARVGSSVSTWVETGELAGLPPGLGGKGGVPLRTLPGKVGEGRPLDTRTRSQMESVLGRDFAGVRVHTEGAAAAYARGLQARAVTMGEDIAFGTGQYQPGTPLGDAVLAHELAHVAQQQGAPATEQAPALAAPRSDLESEADQAALGTVAALWGSTRTGAERYARRARPAGRSGLALQRCSNTVSHPPHVFKSCGFSASTGGPLIIRDDPSAPGTGAVNVYSQPFFGSGTVKISGGTDDEARDWQVGFVQTVQASTRRFIYTNAQGARQASLTGSLPGATRDGNPTNDVPPWYDASRVQTFSNQGDSKSTGMSDQPQWSGIPWESRRPGHPGALATSEGEDRFATWLAVKQRSSADPVFLNWATWKIDWGANYDPVAKTGAGSGSGSQVTGHGDGQGSETPVLGGALANNSATVAWGP